MDQYLAVTKSKWRWLTFWLVIIFLAVVGQQTSVLFGSAFAVYGRWIGVGSLTLWAGMYLLKAVGYFSMPAKWVALIYFWLLWTVIVFLIQQDIDVEFLIKWIIVPLGLIVAGGAIVLSMKSRFSALQLLNTSLLIINLGLMILSVLALLITPNSAFYGGGTRFVGVFTKPQGLSYAAANAFGWAAVTLSVPAWRVQSKIPSRLLWLMTIGSVIIVVMTEVRGTMVGIMVALVLVIVLRLSSKKTAMFLALLFIIIVAWYIVSPEAVPGQLRLVMDPAGNLDLNATLSGRYDLIERSLYELRQNPERLLYGTATRAQLYLSDRDDYVDGGWHDPFALIHEQGLLGFLIYNSVMLAPILLWYRRLRRPRTSAGSSRGNLNSKDELIIWITLFFMIQMYISSLGDSTLIIGHLDHAYYWMAYGMLVVDSSRADSYS